MAKKILCVIRTSSIRQEIESQKMDMVNYLKAKGYKESEIEWLEAPGASARTVNKAYLEMLEAIKSIILGSDTIKCCAVWHLNRLGRVGKYLDEMKNWFKDNHIQLICKTPEMKLLNDDLSYNVSNNVVFSVYASTIESDTLELMEKLKRGRESNRQKGKWNGEQLAFYQTVTDDGYIVIDESKLPLVRLIFSEYATGKYSMISLSNELKSRGYDVSEQAINRLLKEEKLKQYTDDWDKCQEVKQGKVLFTKETKYNHLALKVLKCPDCGCSYVSCGERRYICYRKFWHNKRFPNEPVCTSPAIAVPVMDNILRTLAVNLHFVWLQKSKAESDAEKEAKKVILYQKIDACNKELVSFQERKERIAELYADMAITKKKYQDMIAKVDADKATCTAKLKSYRNEIDQLDMPVEQDYFAYIDESMNYDKRELVLRYIKQATLSTIQLPKRRATIITVEDIYGMTYRYLYDNHGRTNAVYILDENDNLQEWENVEDTIKNLKEFEAQTAQEIRQLFDELMEQQKKGVAN